MEIMPLCFRKYLTDDYWEDCCSDVLSIEDIKELVDVQKIQMISK